MQLKDLINKVRSYTRDSTGSLFTQDDITSFCNEGIERMKQVILEFREVPLLKNNSDELIIVPNHYHHLVSVYSASRCFSQDEQQYQASTYMNEFEAKLNELKLLIGSGDIILTKPDGTIIDSSLYGKMDYVNDIYFIKIRGDVNVAE